MNAEKQVKGPHKKLRQARTASGLSQEALSVMLDISARTVLRWENGESLPKPILIPQLCEILKVTAMELGFSPEGYPLRDIDGMRDAEKLFVESPSPLWHQKKFLVTGSLIVSTIILVSIVLGILALSQLNRISNAAASLTNCGNAFSDQFDGKLDTRWQQINLSSPAAYSVAPNGPLTLSASPYSDLNSQHNNFSAPRLLQPIAGDFTITTKIEFEPTLNWQSAGILLWQDNHTFLRIERGKGQNGSGVDFQQWDDLHQRTGSISNFVDHRTNTGSVELSVQRHGDLFTASWRTSGQEWQPFGKTFIHFEKLMVGLDLVTAPPSQAPEITASYDYFKVLCAKS